MAHLVEALRYGWINMLRSYGLDLTVSGDCFVNMLIYGVLTLKFHNYLHEGIKVSAVLIQKNQIHSVSSYIYLNTHCNIVLQSTPLIFQAVSFRHVTSKNFVFILSAFAKLRKTCISSVISVRPHGTTRFPLDGFSLNFIFDTFSNICGGIMFY